MADISYKEILKKYGPLVSGSAFDCVDLYLFEKFVMPYYKPSKTPWCMAVGATYERSAEVFKQFHKRCYEIDPEKVKTVACNSRSVEENEMDDYDFKMLGTCGDARAGYPWEMPFIEARSEKSRYDLSFIRHPNLSEEFLDNWFAVFANAMDYTAPEGAVVTIINEMDREKYPYLLSSLEDVGVKPVFLEPPGISQNEHSFQHAIGIFKPRF